MRLHIYACPAHGVKKQRIWIGQRIKPTDINEVTILEIIKELDKLCGFIKLIISDKDLTLSLQEAKTKAQSNEQERV